MAPRLTSVLGIAFNRTILAAMNDGTPSSFKATVWLTGLSFITC